MLKAYLSEGREKLAKSGFRSEEFQQNLQALTTRDLSSLTLPERMQLDAMEKDLYFREIENLL